MYYDNLVLTTRTMESKTLKEKVKLAYYNLKLVC